MATEQTIKRLMAEYGNPGSIILFNCLPDTVVKTPGESLCKKIKKEDKK